MYANGEGVARDLLQAYMWADLAASAGEQNALKLRDFAEKQLTADQLSEAQRMSREWKPSIE